MQLSEKFLFKFQSEKVFLCLNQLKANAKLVLSAQNVFIKRIFLCLKWSSEQKFFLLSHPEGFHQKTISFTIYSSNFIFFSTLCPQQFLLYKSFLCRPLSYVHQLLHMLISLFYDGHHRANFILITVALHSLRFRGSHRRDFHS